MTAAPAHRRFTFDVEFDGGRVVTPPKLEPSFGYDELQAARAQGFAEGQRCAIAEAEAANARAVAEAAGLIRAAFAQLDALAHAHREGAARLAMACAGRIADAALARFPEAPAAAALEALGREIEAQPRLAVRAGTADPDRLRAALEEAAERAGYAGQVAVKPDPAQPPAAFSFDWGEGRAAYDPETALARVAEALQTALAAEALHGEPLIPEAP